MEFEEAVSKFSEGLYARERSRKTVLGYLCDLRRFRAYYEASNNIPWVLEDVSKEDVTAFLQALKSDGLQPNTRNRVLNGLRSFFHYAQSEGWIATSPVEGIPSAKGNPSRRPFVPARDMRRCLEQIEHPAVSMAAWLIFYSGLRISECVSLNIGDLNWPERRIVVQRGKGGKSRTVPMADALVPLLEAYTTAYRADAKEDERLLVTARTGQLSASEFQRVLRNVRQDLGWPTPITAHMIRHTFASELVRSGANVVQVQKLLGHSSLTTTSVYTHATQQELMHAVNLLK
jgi:site-specific recombinase XerD